jgi:hypothetical protein
MGMIHAPALGQIGIGICTWLTLLGGDSATAEYSFLLESATGSTETVGRYSFIGASMFDSRDI